MKVVKGLSLLFLGLTLSFTSCSDDDDEDLRDQLVGDYTVEVTVRVPGQDEFTIHNVPVNLAKSGDNDLQISGTVVIPDMGNVTITNLQLPTASVTNQTLQGNSLLAYYSNIPAQTITVGGTDYQFQGNKGISSNNDILYDAAVSKMSSSIGSSLRSLDINLKQVVPTDQPAIKLSISYVYANYNY